MSEALTIGGAETFIVRLANALCMRGINVSLIILRGDLVNKSLLASVSSEISVVKFSSLLLRFMLKFDGFIFRCGIDFSILRYYQTIRLKSYLLKLDASIVHSNLLSADLVTSRACKLANDTPWIATMHGDYLAFEPQGGSHAARIKNFNSAIRIIDGSVAHLVSITDQQSNQISKLMPVTTFRNGFSKIYNGYFVPDFFVKNLIFPCSLIEIPETAFVVGMVARGIKEKGWEVMISAFQKLSASNAWLVLIGDGNYLQSLKAKISNPRIVFVGNVSDPLRYIARFDVGCLPSRIPTESLPTVVIEYLILGKPVIATDVGEVSKMINADSDNPAGVLIPFESVDRMTQRMHVALELLYRDNFERERLAENARVAARKFDMDLCVDAYLAVYEKALLQ